MKAKFYHQPLAQRVGSALQAEIESENWSRLSIAVAWIRRSGMAHIRAELSAFLARGGSALVVVGVDSESTSVEGLEDLLSLSSIGQVSAVVYHNEASPLFHPKLYLFESDKEMKVFVGSANLTEAGLFLNTEAVIELSCQRPNDVYDDLTSAFKSWTDLTTGLAKPLDATLIKALADGGYIAGEAELRKRRNAAKLSSVKEVSPALFGNIPVTAPKLPGSVKYPEAAKGKAAKQKSLDSLVLLMRVRRASATSRRTQIQLPIRLVGTNYFKGVQELVSAHSGKAHGFSYATARGGGTNTIKVEVPEIGPMKDPVMRIERIGGELRYLAFDRHTPEGQQIMSSLAAGVTLPEPLRTALTTPATPDKATWYRFI